MQMLAGAGQKTITVSMIYDPWRSQTYDTYKSMIKWVKKKDGSWNYDYSVFDKWVQFMMSLGIDKLINCYTIAPWNNKFYYYDKAMKTDTFLIAKTGTPLDDMQKVITLVRSVDKDFKISLAGSYHKEIANDIYAYCVASAENFDLSIKAVRIKTALPTTYYTYCWEGEPNTFTFSPLAEFAWLAWYAAAQNYNGYLRWPTIAGPKIQCKMPGSAHGVWRYLFRISERQLYPLRAVD